MATTKAKTINLPAPKFKYGFEIEGAYKVGDSEKIKSATRLVYPNGAVFGADYSINAPYGYHTVEIKTPPQAENKALVNIIRLFEKLQEVGFITNSSCGFHVNISEAATFVDGHLEENEKLKNFCKALSEKLKVQEWRSKFRRNRNSYCCWGKKVQNMYKEKRFTSFNDKCSAINILNAKEYILKSQRRVELRIAGNKDYHANLPLMREYLGDIQKAAHLSYQYAHG